MSNKQTVGVSPKATAASVAALAAPLVARVLADALGWQVDSETVEGLILAGIAGVSALVAAYAAPPGTVASKRPVRRRAPRESGQGLVGVIVAILIVLLVVALVPVTHSWLWLLLLLLIVLVFLF